MDYKLAKQLKDAGFPIDRNWMVKDPQALADIFLPDLAPTLEELIDACEDNFLGLHKTYTGQYTFEWYADTHTHECDCGKDNCNGFNWEHENGKSKKEAVAKLWLKLNIKKK